MKQESKFTYTNWMPTSLKWQPCSAALQSCWKLKGQRLSCNAFLREGINKFKSGHREETKLRTAVPRYAKHSAHIMSLQDSGHMCRSGCSHRPPQDCPLLEPQGKPELPAAVRRVQCHFKSNLTCVGAKAFTLDILDGWVDCVWLSWVYSWAWEPCAPCWMLEVT